MLRRRFLDLDLGLFLGLPFERLKLPGLPLKLSHAPLQFPLVVLIEEEAWELGRHRMLRLRET